MKTFKFFGVFLVMSILILSSNSIFAAKKINVIVETINVQELNKNNSLDALRRLYKREIEAFNALTNRLIQYDSFVISNSKDNNKLRSFNIINQDFEIVDKKSINACKDPENIDANMYAIENERLKSTIFSDPKTFRIYKNKGTDCDELMEVSKYAVSRATLFNSQLYLETYNSYLKKDRKLYKLEDDNRLVKVANTNGGITSITKLNEYLLYTHGNNLYVLKNDGQHNLVKNNTKDEIKSTSYFDGKLYIVFKNKKTKNVYVNRYNANLDKLDKFNNLPQLKLNDTINLVNEPNNEISKIDFNVSSKSIDLIVFSDELVCKRDFSSCKFTRIKGDKIVGVINNFVIYSSNRIYISNYDLNSIDPLMEYSELHILEDIHNKVDDLFIKVYNDKNQYQFIKYKLSGF